MEVIDPSTGEAFDTVPDATAGDVDSAVAAAKAACPGWRDSSAKEREAVLSFFRQLDDAMSRVVAHVGDGCDAAAAEAAVTAAAAAAAAVVAAARSAVRSTVVCTFLTLSDSTSLGTTRCPTSCRSTAA